MNKIAIFLILIGALLLSTGLASATSGKAGSIIPLQLNNYQITTNGLIITPSWKPAYIKWYLVDPAGNTKYMVQSGLDSVQQVGSGFNSATWSITENSGEMKIPAFAGQGTWIVKGRLYDVNKVFILQFSSKAEFTAQTVTVGEYSFLDNFMAPPYYFYLNLGGNPLTGDLEFSFAFPDLIYLIAGVIIAILVIINIVAFIRRKKNA